MTQFDHIYNKLVNDILEKGTDITNNVRTVYADGSPAYYRSLIGYQFRYDNSTDEPPVLTTRYSPYKSAIRETYWMWFLRSNNVDILEEMGCKYWREWRMKEPAYEDLIYVQPKRIDKTFDLLPVKVNEIINDDLPLRTSKNHGDYYILENFINEDGKERYRIQFKNTGYITECSKSSVAHNLIKDKYSRTEQKIGYYGEYKTPEIENYFGKYLNRWVDIWRGIIKRTSEEYRNKHNNLNYYDDIMLHPYFESCENFLKWVMKNNRYSNNELGILQIDKDYYSSNYYGPDSCIIVTPKENSLLTLSTWYTYNNKFIGSKRSLCEYLSKQLNIELIKETNDFKNNPKDINTIIDNAQFNKYVAPLIEDGIIKEIHPKNLTDKGYIRFSLKMHNTIGKSYGYELAQPIYDFNNQLDYIIHELKYNPNSRRIITEMWVPQDLKDMALAPCLHLCQWSVLNNKLYLELRQRSADVALGVVSNLLQYSILHKLVARECGLEPAEIIYTIHNAHIYDRHIDTIKEQINSTPFDCNPKLIINYPDKLENFHPDDVKIENYPMKDMPKYKYEVAI